MLSKLFGSRNPLTPDEREAIMDYYIRETELAVLQTAEADRSNTVMLQHGNNLASPQSMPQVLEASKRLALSASEVLDRHTNIGAVPDCAAASYAGWHVVYLRYQEWAEARLTAIEAASRGLAPNVQRVEQLLRGMETARRSAEREDGKLFKRIGITTRDLQRIYATRLPSSDHPSPTPTQGSTAPDLQGAQTKECASCGQAVDHGVLACPKCGGGIFVVDKTRP